VKQKKSSIMQQAVCSVKPVHYRYINRVKTLCLSNSKFQFTTTKFAGRPGPVFQMIANFMANNANYSTPIKMNFTPHKQKSGGTTLGFPSLLLGFTAFVKLNIYYHQSSI
jgi:hypothetical protein